MFRDVADSVTTAVRTHRRALGGGADAWWVFVGRVLPDSIRDLARALQQGKGESEGDGLREASRGSPERDTPSPPQAQDENRAPNTQDWMETNAALIEEQKQREKEAAIWGSLLRKEAKEAGSASDAPAPAAP